MDIVESVVDSYCLTTNKKPPGNQNLHIPILHIFKNRHTCRCITFNVAKACYCYCFIFYFKFYFFHFSNDDSCALSQFKITGN
jgi:hypothetical protein